MADGIGVRAAFGRSRELVRGHFWIVLVVLALELIDLKGPVANARS